MLLRWEVESGTEKKMICKSDVKLGDMKNYNLCIDLEFGISCLKQLSVLQNKNVLMP